MLIAVHGLTGSRAQVVRQYRRVSEILARELDEAPLPETDATYRQALARTVERSLERAATIEPTDSRPRSSSSAARRGLTTAATRRHNKDGPEPTRAGSVVIATSRGYLTMA